MQAGYGQQPVFYPQQQNKGPLVPGQTITINAIAVQVERYLSQGGYAHVYVVRTAQPVNGTTQHVLKRVAVPDETMLSEVKKEVDIMRLLKRHPNIVQLIDAAWHRTANGMYEVFILMEFCSGGGIIDMMNRRLRERLTEKEILQIFVDVCEAVAAMHNLRPALLHRDLKIENILQASETSFKLCDFGSATPVSKPPTNSMEIRALEADLNRHTTLQYRAPEMVDVHLRRPVDEKSDVWALGVLLYKLCFYTTPFEEHGPLAILNVQYKTPPFPVYSSNMNALIDSMLKEYGTQRPSVFEVLTQVHRLRGTAPKFTYNPQKQAPLSPRQAQFNINPLDDLIAYRSPAAQTSPNAGVQAREKVLEAIAPMRRGRPEHGSPKKESQPLPQGDYLSYPSAARASRTGVAPTTASRDPWSLTNTSIATTTHPPSSGDAWSVEGQSVSRFITRNGPVSQGFGDSFGDSFDGRSSGMPGTSPTPSSNIRPSIPSQASSSSPSKFIGGRKDAFDGLGFLSADRPAMTLGEAQKSGLPPNGTPVGGSTSQPASTAAPSPSPRPTPSPHPPPAHISSAWRQQTPSSFSTAPTSRALPGEELTAEERFPSLEELDMITNSPSPPVVPPKPSVSRFAAGPAPNFTGGLRPLAPAIGASPVPSHAGGVRSQQVTGTAMREAREMARKKVSPTPIDLTPSSLSTDVTDRPSSPDSLRTSRPQLSHRHRSSANISSGSREFDREESLLPDARATVASPPSSELHPPAARQEPRDWLTGDDSETSAPVLRQSPSKRTSVLQTSALELTRRTSESAQLIDIAPPLPPRPIPRRDSSSADEGPEEVGAGGLTRLRDRTRPTRKGRQSSVHDLVGLYDAVGSGGVTRAPPMESPTRERPKTFGTSVVAPPMSTPSPSLTARQVTGSRSPALPPTPSTAAAVNRKPLPDVDRTGSPAISDARPSGSIHRRATSTAQAPSSTGALPTPKPSAFTSQTPSRISTTESKLRPQSFMFPLQRATSDTPISPSTTTTTAVASLAPPPNASARTRLRRSSISEMVSRFEAINASSGSTPTTSSFGIISPIAASNQQLQVNTDAAASPTAASQRFPRISPTASPIHSRFPTSSLAPPPGSPVKVQSRRSSWGDPRTTTTTASPVPIPRQASPVLKTKPLPVASTGGGSFPVGSAGSSVLNGPRPLTQRKTSIDRVANGSGLGQQAQAPPASIVSPPPLRRPTRDSMISPPMPASTPTSTSKGVGESSASGSATEDDSPEPYQGVGKLIQQWQQRGEGGLPTSGNRPAGGKKLPSVVGVGNNKWS